MNLGKHYAAYLLQATLAWLVWALLIFAAGAAVRALLGLLEDALGVLPKEASVVETIVGFAASLPGAAGAALAMVLTFALVRWPIDNPHIDARLEAERME